MKKRITVLIIDDVDQSRTINALEKQLSKKFEFEAISVKTTSVELRKEDSDHLDPEKLKAFLQESVKNKTINWVFTDFNLAEDDVDGLTVVNMLYGIRSTIKVVMYSGDLHAVVKRVIGKASLDDVNEDDIVEAVSQLLKFNIIDYIKRDNYKDKLIELANREDDPTVQDYFIELLREHSEMEFKSCYDRLKGKTLGEIADMIEKNSNKRTDAWTRELVEQTIAYLVKINE